MFFLKRDKEEKEDESKFNKGREEESGEEGKKKRREKKNTPKPWGKKERLLVLSILVITIGTSLVLSLYAKGWKLPGISGFSFPDLSLIKEEVIVIEKKVSIGSEDMIDAFDQKTNSLKGVYGLYVSDIETGESVGVYENNIFEAASLVKLPVMAAMYLEEERGNLDLEDKYILKESDKRAGAGVLYYEDEGYELTYRELIELMGKHSDNTAFSVARGILGDETINSVIDEIGMENTLLTKNTTTPRDIGVFFQKLWDKEIIFKSHRDELLSYLIDTEYEGWLTEGIPEDVDFSHKYGREVHVVNDAGIVFTENPYIVVVLSKDVSEREADDVFPELSKIIYKGMMGY